MTRALCRLSDIVDGDAKFNPAIDKKEAADIQSAAVAIPFATGLTPFPAT